MSYLIKLENSVKKFCNQTGKSFEAVMHTLVNSEEDFSELVINSRGHTEVITLDGYSRGTVLLSENYNLIKL